MFQNGNKVKEVDIVQVRVKFTNGRSIFVEAILYTTRRRWQLRRFPDKITNRINEKKSQNHKSK